MIALKRCFILTICLAALVWAGTTTALDRYVAAPDPNYKFQLLNTIPGDGFTTYVLEMTSQQYLTSAEVNRPIWQHWVTIVRPDKVTTSTGFLFITGGSNGGKPPAGLASNFTSMATTTGSVVSELRMVPNEPLTFTGDKPRTEDGIIAYTWDKFLRTGDEKWPLRLPMTKAAVRAMDTVTSFCGGQQGGGVTVDHFVVSGGSKRGWTTWTTAAVDKRVVAIVPMVIDMLNIEKSFTHHWQAYGFWAPAVKDYVDLHLMDWSGTKEYKALMQIVEPYSYRDRLTMPKLMINASGDQFFLPDSSQFYFDDLKGEKNLRYVPNTDHSMRNSDAQETLAAFYEMVIKGTQRPRFTFHNAKNGSIEVRAADQPSEVKLWQATNPKARDFRLMTIGPIWKSTPIERKNGVYVGSVPKPAAGWTAFFVELTYPGGKYPLKLTSGVRVLPDKLPFPPPKAKPPR